MPCLIGLGPTEIIVILVIILLLFGGKKIPELFRGLGEGVREFKRGTEEAAKSSESPSAGGAEPKGDSSPQADTDSD